MILGVLRWVQLVSAEMERLDLQISVPGYPTLSEPVRLTLTEGEELTRMAYDAQQRLLGHAAYGDWLSVEIEDVGVFVSPDWVVSIHGRRLYECVVAMSVLMSEIGQRLAVPVAFKLHPQTSLGHDQSLYEVLKQQARRDQIVRWTKWVLTILASASAGALLQWAASGG